jgi:methylmalonyl-CoA mutase
MNKSFFKEFEKSSAATWTAQVIKDLKGKDFDQNLISKTFDGIPIRPFYTEEDIPQFESLKSFQNKYNPSTEIAGFSPRIWSNIFKVPKTSDAKSANKLILEALMNGCDGLLLEMDGSLHLDTLLSNVELPYIQIYLTPLSIETSLEFLEKFKSWYETKDWPGDALRGGILWDGSAAFLQNKSDWEKTLGFTKTLISKTNEFPHFFPMCIDFSIYHEAGGSTLQELKYGFAAFIEVLDRLETPEREIEQLFRKTVLNFSVGDQYFEQISKLRAARIFHHALASLYGITLRAEEINVFCQSSSWSKSLLDINSNLLRNTVEGMAGILGGCNALYIKPHDSALQSPTSFSLRLARNISNILKEESYFDKVQDPVAGSFFIESLTMKLLERLKPELMAIEEEGGWWELFRNGKIQDEIKNSRKVKQEMVLKGELTKVGVNKYRYLKEDFSKIPKRKEEEEPWQIMASRETELLEEKYWKKYEA